MSNIRSLGQISEKPCAPSRGNICSPIFMKLGKNVFLDESWMSLKIDHVL